MDGMDRLGTDFHATGSVMTPAQLREYRIKRGECVTCGRKCFQKKLFKMTPITEPGKVLKGRCLNCNPMDSGDGGKKQSASQKRASREDLERFSRSQSNLALGLGNLGAGRGGRGGPRRTASSDGLGVMPVRRGGRRAPAPATQNNSSDFSLGSKSTSSQTKNSNNSVSSSAAPPMTRLRSAKSEGGYMPPNRDMGNGLKDHHGGRTLSASSGGGGGEISSPRRRVGGRTPVTTAATAPPAPPSIDSPLRSPTRSPAGRIKSPMKSQAPLISSTTTSSPRSAPGRRVAHRTRSMEEVPLHKRSLVSSKNNNNNNNSHAEAQQRQNMRRSFTASSSSLEYQHDNSSSNLTSSPGDGAIRRPSFQRNISQNDENDVEPDEEEEPIEVETDEEDDLGHNLSASAHGMMNRASVYYRPSPGEFSSEDSDGASFVDELVDDDDDHDHDEEDLGDSADLTEEEQNRGRYGRDLIHKYDQQKTQAYRNTSSLGEDSGGSGSGPYGNQDLPAYQPSGEEIREAMDRMNRRREPSSYKPPDGDNRHADRRYPARQQNHRDEYDDHEQMMNQIKNQDSSNQSLSDGRSGHNTEEEIASFERASFSKQHGILNRGGEVNLSEMSSSKIALEDEDMPVDGGGYSEDDRYDSDRGRHRSSPHRASAREKYNSDSQRSLDSMSSNEGGHPHDLHNYAMDGSGHLGHNKHRDASLSMENGRQPPQDYGMQSSSSHSYGKHGMQSSSNHSYGKRSHTSNSVSSGIQHDQFRGNANPRGGGGAHVSRQSSQASSDVSLTEEGLNRLSSAGGDIVGIVYIMLDFPDSEPVQTSCLKEISELHLTPDDCDAFAEAGGMEALADAMERFPNHGDLHLCACRALCNLSATPENQLGLVDVGAADLVLNGTMETFAGIPELQEQALAALANLAALEDNLEPLLDKQIVQRTVQTMNKHGKDIHVQMKGCSVIANLASHPSLVKEEIMANGGGGAVVMCLALHQKDAKLQEKGLQALRNLSANCDENKTELGHIGGIDSAISAMQVHRNDPYVQEAGAWALFNLAGNMNNKKHIADSSGIDVILRALWVHPDITSVHEWCLRALFSLTMDDSNIGLALEVGSISAVVASMQGHERSPLVQEMGCAILANLGVDEQAKLRIVDEEALDAIVLAMVLFVDDFKVQERACDALLQIAIPDNLTALQATNVNELVRTAAGNFPDECGDLSAEFLDLIDQMTSDYNAR